MIGLGLRKQHCPNMMALQVREREGGGERHRERERERRRDT